MKKKAMNFSGTTKKIGCSCSGNKTSRPTANVNKRGNTYAGRRMGNHTQFSFPRGR